MRRLYTTHRLHALAQPDAQLLIQEIRGQQPLQFLQYRSCLFRNTLLCFYQAMGLPDLSRLLIGMRDHLLDIPKPCIATLLHILIRWAIPRVK